MGQSITQTELLDRLEREATQSASGRCGCTLILGSGFSYPIVPTTSQIVREDLPWFIWCQQSEKDGPTPRDFANTERRTELADKAKEHARTFWQLVKEWASQHKNAMGQPLAFSLGDDGLPDRAGVTNAYMSAFSTACPRGLGTDEMARRFLAEIIKRGGKRLNPAHLYLASLMSEKPHLFRTIFTTNFDPLLQRSLQLVNMPYFVSDRPDVMQHPDDDGDVDALHLVHVHGSIYRYLLLNTPEDIVSFAELNQPLLQQYFRKHAVLIIGYGGWDDAITRALAKVDRFSKNLYWCDLGPSPERSGISDLGRALIQKQSSAFYVPIKGADDLLVSLHQRLVGHALPRLFREPITVVQSQLEQCDLNGITVARIAEEDPAKARASTNRCPDERSGASASPSATDEALDLGVQVRLIQARLENAQRVVRGEAADQNEARLQERIAKATDLYFGAKYADAFPLIDEILSTATLSNTSRALWLFRRGVTHGRVGRGEQEIRDYTTVINLLGAPAELVAKSLHNRGVAHGQAGRGEQAIADYTSAIDLPGAPAEQVAKAMVNRGFMHGRAARDKQEIADYTSAINLPGAPAELVAKALYNRGVAHGLAGRSEQSIADYTSAINLPGTPAEQVAKAMVNRGVMHARAGRGEQAIADYTSAINLPGTPAEQVSKAMVNRGVIHARAGRSEQAIADYTSAINLPGTPAEQVARAMVNRGVTLREAGRTELAIADWTAAINLRGAPPEQVAKALFNRGVMHDQAGRSEQARSEFNAIVELKGVPIDIVKEATAMLKELNAE